MLHWYGYVPGALKTSASDWPLPIVSVVHVPSTRLAVCPAVSLLVQLTMSPTLAVTGSGEKAKSLIDTLTVGVASAPATAQAAALLAPPAATDAGTPPVLAAGLGDALLPQAARARVMAMARAPRTSRCISVDPPSCPPDRAVPGGIRDDTPLGEGGFSRTGIVPRVTQSFPGGGPAAIEPAGARWLARHEARCHAISGREVRELGDGVLLHDPTDREPFWNRLAGVGWPSAAGAFDHRLAEVIALFASLDRIPHIWPQPGLDEPADLAARLIGHGFADVGSGQLMGLDPATAALDEVAGPDVSIVRLDGAASPANDDTKVIRGIGAVLAEAFTIEPLQADAIEADTRAAMVNPSFHSILARVDGQPAATVRRTTFDGVSYLSSIGTRPAFRGRGLGRLVTALATQDSIAAGSRLTYLGVFAENDVARRLYSRLGFVPIGQPAPDLLLTR
jgi:ribosomal protein S18 acetylase RimI-like enzyme